MSGAPQTFCHKLPAYLVELLRVNANLLLGLHQRPDVVVDVALVRSKIRDIPARCQLTDVGVAGLCVLHHAHTYTHTPWLAAFPPCLASPHPVCYSCIACNCIRPILPTSRTAPTTHRGASGTCHVSMLLASDAREDHRGHKA